MKSKLHFLSLLTAVACAHAVRGELANVAGDGTAYVDRSLYSNWPIGRLNDHDTATVFHADTDDAPNLNYSLDLGKDQLVSELRIFPRQDNCCSSRLKNFRVSLHSDSAGTIGAEIWGQTLYADGTDPGSAPGTVVKIPLPSPQTGRWVKIQALDDPPADYALQMTELQVFADVPASQVNRAEGKIATANQPVYSGQNVQQLVDGSRSGPVHGLETVTPGFAYTINLGSSVKLDHIWIWARQDGCCPERLTNYRVTVLKDDAGQPGVAAWKADLHADGSTPGSEIGSKDILTAALDAAGEFRGQWLRVESLEDPISPFALQITEIEAYGEAEGGVNVLVNKQPASASTGIARTVTFEVGAVAVNGDATKLGYQWKKNGAVIPGATNATYTTPPILVADDKAKFQAVVSYPGLADQLSDEATVRVNLAFHADATNNRPLWPPGGWNISVITDGDRGSFVHHDQTIDPGAEYTVNLGAGVKFEEIDLYPRQDGCCPERLSNIQVSVHADNAGAIGTANWSADLFTDGSNAGSGAGVVVKLLANLDANPAHKFEGQWLRILSLDDPEPPYPLQLGEVEVFGSFANGLPILSVFVQPADTGTVPGRTARLSTEGKVINGDPGKITYKWFRAGVAIPGADTNSYTTPPLLPADDGTLFHCVLSYPGVADVVTRDAKVFFDGNYAKNQPATTTVPLWAPGNWNIGMIVDGNRLNLVHADQTPASGLAYEVNLGVDVTVDHIDIYPRQDGCCPDRFANVRVSLHQDNNGAAGNETWHADLFPDEGSNAGSGEGVVVHVVSGDGTGQFHGQWIRLLALDEPVKDYALQLGELEVYGTADIVAPPTPTLSITRAAAGITITYANGVLEAISKIGDAWAPVAGATSPFSGNAAQSEQYFRVRQ